MPKADASALPTRSISTNGEGSSPERVRVSYYLDAVTEHSLTVNEAIVHQYIAFWSDKAQVGADGHKWTYQSHRELSERLGLTPNAARKAVDSLTAKGVLDRTQKGVLRTYYYRPTDHPANQPFVNITDASVDSTDANGDSTHASGKSTDASVPEHTTLSVEPTVADTVDPSVAYVRNAPRTRTPTDHGFPEVVVDFNRKVVDLYVDAGVKDAQYAKYDYDDSDWLNGSEKLLSGMSALGLDERSRFDALKTIVNLVATSDRWKHHKRPRQLSEDWKDMLKDADTDHDATGDHSERRRNGRRRQPDSEDAKTTRRTRRHNSEGADDARPDTDRGDHEGPRARMQRLRAEAAGKQLQDAAR